MNLQSWIDAATPSVCVAALSATTAQVFTHDPTWQMLAALVGVIALAAHNESKARP